MARRRELEKYYLGDAAWKNSVSACALEWQRCRFKRRLVATLEGNKDIAQVIYFLVGESSMEWVHEPIPELDKVSPIECLRDPVLTMRLRSMLMRMPC